MRAGGPFIERNGPIYGRVDDDGELMLGFRVLPEQCNQLDIAHGGWMASFMDTLLPLGVRFSPHGDLAERFLLTINLSLDFMAAAPLGAWIEGRAERLSQTRSLVFVQGMIRSEGRLLMRGSATYRIGPVTPMSVFDLLSKERP